MWGRGGFAVALPEGRRESTVVIVAGAVLFRDASLGYSALFLLLFVVISLCVWAFCLRLLACF